MGIERDRKPLETLAKLAKEHGDKAEAVEIRTLRTTEKSLEAR